MTEEATLKQILVLQDKAYGLLMWLRKGMDKGFIPPANAHQFMNAAEATRDWIVLHVQNFPPDYRPDTDDSEELDKFSNLFSAFLMSSFDISEKTGQRLYSEGGHCFCSMCSYLVEISHLNSKKLTKKDKSRAHSIKLTTAEQICLDNNLRYSADSVNSALKDCEFSQNLAIVAYVKQLVRRANGIVEGPSVLALWREFAWTPKGSPKKKFKLTFGVAQKAQDFVIQALS